MIRKVDEFAPVACSQCGGEMRVIAFFTDHAVVDRFIAHMKVGFSPASRAVGERPSS